MLESYKITESLIRNSKVVFYETLLNYNVYYLKKIEDVAVGHIPIKY